jgi:hypothetical protein
VREIVWRLASTFEIYVLATGDATLSDASKKTLEQKFGTRLDKPRPWGLVMFEVAADKAFVFSRTSDLVKADERSIRHPFHTSIECHLDKDGALEYMKRMLINPKLWLSSKEAVRVGQIKLSLVCPCDQPSCSKLDKTLKRALGEVGKSKPIILTKDAIGNGK